MPRQYHVEQYVIIERNVPTLVCESCRREMLDPAVEKNVQAIIRGISEARETHPTVTVEYSA